MEEDPPARLLLEGSHRTKKKETTNKTKQILHARHVVEWLKECQTQPA